MAFDMAGSLLGNLIFDSLGFLSWKEVGRGRRRRTGVAESVSVYESEGRSKVSLYLFPVIYPGLQVKIGVLRAIYHVGFLGRGRDLRILFVS